MAGSANSHTLAAAPALLLNRQIRRPAFNRCVTDMLSPETPPVGSKSSAAGDSCDTTPTTAGRQGDGARSPSEGLRTRETQMQCCDRTGSQGGGGNSTDSQSKNHATVPQKASVALRQRMKKTKLCKWAAEGRCGRGVNCFFAHSLDEIKNRPDLRRTRMCTEFKGNGFCSLGGDCKFAHAEEDVVRLENVGELPLVPEEQMQVMSAKNSGNRGSEDHSAPGSNGPHGCIPSPSITSKNSHRVSSGRASDFAVPALISPETASASGGPERWGLHPSASSRPSSFQTASPSARWGSDPAVSFTEASGWSAPQDQRALHTIIQPTEFPAVLAEALCVSPDLAVSSHKPSHGNGVLQSEAPGPDQRVGEAADYNGLVDKVHSTRLMMEIQEVYKRLLRLVSQLRNPSLSGTSGAESQGTSHSRVIRSGGGSAAWDEGTQMLRRVLTGAVGKSAWMQDAAYELTVALLDNLVVSSPAGRDVGAATFVVRPVLDASTRRPGAPSQAKALIKTAIGTIATGVSMSPRTAVVVPSSSFSAVSQSSYNVPSSPSSAFSLAATASEHGLLPQPCVGSPAAFTLPSGGGIDQSECRSGVLPYDPVHVNRITSSRVRPAWLAQLPSSPPFGAAPHNAANTFLSAAAHFKAEGSAARLRFLSSVRGYDGASVVQSDAALLSQPPKVGYLFDAVDAAGSIGEPPGCGADASPRDRLTLAARALRDLHEQKLFLDFCDPFLGNSTPLASSSPVAAATGSAPQLPSPAATSLAATISDAAGTRGRWLSGVITASGNASPCSSATSSLQFISDPFGVPRVSSECSSSNIDMEHPLSTAASSLPAPNPNVIQHLLQSLTGSRCLESHFENHRRVGLN